MKKINLIVILLLIITLVIPCVLSSNSEGSSTDWYMMGKWLNHTTDDGVSYSILSGLNYTTYTTDNDLLFSPTIYNGFIYTGSYDSFLNGQSTIYKLNASNISQLLDSKYIGGAVSSGVTSEPVLANGYLYININGRLNQINVSNLSQTISSTVLATHLGYPAVNSNYVYAGYQSSGVGRVYQLNASNVAQSISSYAKSSCLFSMPIISGNYVYSTAFGSSCSDTVYQLNATTVSQVIASYSGIATKGNPMAVYNDYLYLGTDSNILQLNASNVSQLVSSYAVASHSNPLVVNNKVYFVNSNVLYQLNASLVSQSLGSYTLPSGTFSDSTTYNSGQMYTINSPTYNNGYIYVGSSDGKLYKFDEANITQPVKNYTLGSSKLYSPAIANNYAYVPSVDNKLYQQALYQHSIDSLNTYINYNATLKIQTNNVTNGYSYFFNFNASWTDDNSTVNQSLYICKTNAPCNSTVVNQWCNSSISTDPITCHLPQLTLSDVGAYNYYAFLINTNNDISPVYSGTFNIYHNSPLLINNATNYLTPKYTTANVSLTSWNDNNVTYVPITTGSPINWTNFTVTAPNSIVYVNNINGTYLGSNNWVSPNFNIDQYGIWTVFVNSSDDEGITNNKTWTFNTSLGSSTIVPSSQSFSQQPSNTSILTISITNAGNGYFNFIRTLEGDIANASRFNTVFNLTSPFNVSQSSTTNILTSITSDASLPDGVYTGNITFTRQDGEVKKVAITITVTASAVGKISLNPTTQSTSFTQGSSANWDLNISNTGNGNLSYCNLTAYNQIQPFTTFNNSNFNITNGLSQIIKVSYSSTTNGTYTGYITVICRANSGGGTDQENVNPITVTINPQQQTGGGGSDSNPPKEDLKEIPINASKLNRNFSIERTLLTDSEQSDSFAGKPVQLINAIAYLKNYGNESVKVKISCQGDSCSWVKFNRTDYDLIPPKIAYELIYKINIPPTVQEGSSYKFTIVGTNEDGLKQEYPVTIKISSAQSSFDDFLSYFIEPINLLIWILLMLIWTIAINKSKIKKEYKAPITVIGLVIITIIMGFIVQNVCGWSNLCIYQH